MDTNPRKLTISLLCSGRSQEMKACLDSLIPVLEGVNSELIVVDTGCDEESLNILDTFVHARVIKFSWCDDFASARNAGLECANGQWFMYIDDDECLGDATELIEFFNSGEYKNFVAATYIVRSYNDPDRLSYTDNSVLRLFTLETGARFTGLIHEYPINLVGNTKHLNVLADHTGYMDRSPEALKRHYDRNSQLLNKMMELEPDNLRWPEHLVMEYRSVGEFEALRSHCLTFLDKISGRVDEDAVAARSTFATGVVLSSVKAAINTEFDSQNCLDASKKSQLKEKYTRLYSQAIADYDKMISLPDGIYDSGEACLHNLAALAYYKLKEYDRSYEESMNYLDMYYDVAIKHQKDVKAYRAQVVLCHDIFEDSNRDEMVLTATRCITKGNCILANQTELESFAAELGCTEEFFAYLHLQITMAKLSNSIKANVKLMIEQNNLELAKSTLDELIKMTGMDDEIEELLTQIVH